MIIFPTHGHRWLTSCPSCFNPGKEPLYPYTEGWVGSRVGLDVLEKRKFFCPYQDLNPRTIQPYNRHLRPAGGVQLQLYTFFNLSDKGGC
jgi:hypothetical protein